MLDRLRRGSVFSTGGARVYAVGDVHGCFDLLVELLQRIENDNAARPPAETHIVLLGDFVDRGPGSAQICDLLFSMAGSPRFHALKGNHEQAMVDVLHGVQASLRFWLQYGGVETAQSFGCDPHLVARACIDPRVGNDLIAQLRTRVPEEMTAWLHNLPAYLEIGDYLFVHAGVRPHVALDQQSVDDMLWIREPFLDSRAHHPWMVVHGHSEVDEPDIRANRIGIDTAGYRTGRLTAIGLEGSERWFLSTG